MVVKLRGRYDIGTLIIKKSNDIIYNGNVISDNEWWYEIKCEDDDKEELTCHEMPKFVQQAKNVTCKQIT